MGPFCLESHEMEGRVVHVKHGLRSSMFDSEFDFEMKHLDHEMKHENHENLKIMN